MYVHYICIIHAKLKKKSVRDTCIFPQCKEYQSFEFLANVSRKTEKRRKKDLSWTISRRAVTEITHQWNYQILG